MRELIELMPMVALLAWAAAIDVRSRRIPNWLTVSLVVAGVARCAFPTAQLSAGQAFAGVGVGFALPFVLFALGAMGGGDVKMFAGIGAWVGAGRVAEMFAAAAVVGMLIVLIQAVRDGRVAALTRSSAVIVLNAATVGDLTPPPESADATAGGKARLPYAVPTLAGVVLLIMLEWRWL